MLITSSQLDETFAALADPTRRAILERLGAGEATVNQLASPFKISAPAISRHLRVLESAGLISKRREGQHLHCRLEAETLKAAASWLDFYRKFWSDSFDQLAEHLKASDAASSERPSSKSKTSRSVSSSSTRSSHVRSSKRNVK